jgi:hypothetical protein
MSSPVLAIGTGGFADPVSAHTVSDSTATQAADLHTTSRPLMWALFATIVWVAVIVGGLIALGRSGRLAAMDATTVAAYAAGIFTPITAFWLMALAVMRGGVLASEQGRVEVAIAQLVSPVDAARARASHLANALELQILRMSAAADAAEAKASALDAAAQREAETLKNSGDSLDLIRAQVDKTVVQLQDAMAQAQGLVGRLEAVLPETAKRLTTAVSEANVQTEALVSASVKVVDASTSARQAAELVLPSFNTAVSKLDDAGDRIAERLSLLEIQAAAATRAMESSAEKASEALENSRHWVEQQITTIETSVARVETDVVRRLETLTLSFGETTAQMARDMPAMIDTLGTQLAGIETSMKDRMGDITTAFDAAVDSWDNASMATTLQLIDSMSRARAMSTEAVAAAKETTAAIVASTQAALTQSATHAQSAAIESLQALQQQAQQVAALTQQAEDRHAAMRLALQDKIHADFARTADQLIDRLNAYAVDVTKLYAGNVTEEELRGYLKGDRHSFVRRFARTITNTGDASVIAQITQRLTTEPEFADITNRYLNAFETLLKLGQQRSERDALTVALLTSDLGKMYIALARAAGRMG